MTQYTVGNRTQNGAATVMQSNFYYYNDGRIKYNQDTLSPYTVNPSFESAYAYDSFGRLAEAYAGSEAHDFYYGTSSGTPTGAYRQSYTHDGFNNLTRRTGRMWSEADTFPVYGAAIQFDSHNHNPFWGYDAAGNVTGDDQRTYSLDAAGRIISQSDSNGNSMTQLIDGDGQRIGAIRRKCRWLPSRRGVARCAALPATHTVAREAGRIVSEDLMTKFATWVDETDIELEFCDVDAEC